MQVDTKFIPLACDGVLAMMDQHAAHERVLLERLQEQVLLSASCLPWKLVLCGQVHQP